LSIKPEGEHLPESLASPSDIAAGEQNREQPAVNIVAGDEAQSQTTVPAAEDDGQEETQTRPTGWDISKAIAREAIETIVLALILVFLIQLVIRNFRVDGHSMEPNLQHGQYLVVDKISYKLPFGIRPPQRGDVIVFISPTHSNKDFVKRIIGLPGDKVEIRNGDAYLNGELLPNTYNARLDHSSRPSIVIPEGELYVMGDNRANSNDSRSWGTLKTDQVVGKAWLSYWPSQSWGLIPNDTPTVSATLKSVFSRTQTAP